MSNISSKPLKTNSIRINYDTKNSAEDIEINRLVKWECVKTQKRIFTSNKNSSYCDEFFFNNFREKKESNHNDCLNTTTDVLNTTAPFVDANDTLENPNQIREEKPTSQIREKTPLQNNNYSLDATVSYHEEEMMPGEDTITSPLSSTPSKSCNSLSNVLFDNSISPIKIEYPLKRKLEYDSDTERPLKRRKLEF